MNIIPGIQNGYASLIIDLFKALPADIEIILFGSRAKGTFREGSDIDIALKGSSANLDVRDLILSHYDDLNLPWKLDIAIYSLITEPALKDHIDRVGLKLPR